MFSTPSITLCFVLMCLWCSTLAQNKTNKVKVSVYYESLCPDSKKFINTQLFPALTNKNSSLAAYVNLKLVPFGKSKFFYDQQFKSYKFSCHHGEDECVGNRIHACGLKRIADPAVALKFVNCMMGNVDRSNTPVEFPTVQCATDSVVPNLAEVKNCASHNDGQTYLADFGTETENLKPALTSVPTIVFNDEHIAADSQEAEKNFVHVLCKYLGKIDGADKPTECNDTNAATGHLSQYMLVLIASLISLAYQFHN